MIKLDESIFLNRRFYLFWGMFLLLSAAVQMIYIARFIYDTQKLSVNAIEDVATIVSGPHDNWEVEFYRTEFRRRFYRNAQRRSIKVSNLHGYKVLYRGREQWRYSSAPPFQVGEQVSIVVDPDHNWRFLFGKAGFSAANLRKANSEFVDRSSWIFGPMRSILMCVVLSVVLMIVMPKTGIRWLRGDR